MLRFRGSHNWYTSIGNGECLLVNICNHTAVWDTYQQYHSLFIMAEFNEVLRNSWTSGQLGEGVKDAPTNYHILDEEGLEREVMTLHTLQLYFCVMLAFGRESNTWQL